MIVEDVKFNADIIERYLVENDVKILKKATNGLEAVKFLEDCIEKRENLPDLITMDLEMPVMDGKKASMEIRELEKKHNLPPIPIVIISGNTIAKDTFECLNKDGLIKAHSFARKPIDRIEFSALLEKIKRLIQNRNHNYLGKSAVILDDDQLAIILLKEILSHLEIKIYTPRNI